MDNNEKINGKSMESLDDAAAEKVAGGTHLGGVAVEHRLVVGLVVFGKDLVEFCAGLVAVLLAGFLGHLDTAEGHEGALEGLVGLKAYDLF